MVEDVLLNSLPAGQVAQLYGVSAAQFASGSVAFERWTHSPGRPFVPTDLEPTRHRWREGTDHRGALQKRMTQARIAEYLALSKATVGRVLTRVSMARLSDLKPVEPVQHYENERPGDLIHIYTKKLGRIEKTGIAQRTIVVTAAEVQAERAVCRYR
jgi:hypothetical protein